MTIKLPPCIKAVAEAKDTDALEEVLAFYHTFGGNPEPVLWALGWLDLTNYEQRKVTAEGMMKAAPPLVCPATRPDRLSRYCSEDCPLRDPKTWLSEAIKAVYLTPGLIPTSRVLIVEMHSGDVFRSSDFAYSPVDPKPFFDNVSAQLSDWLADRYNLVLGPAEITEVLRKKLWG